MPMGYGADGWSWAGWRIRTAGPDDRLEMLRCLSDGQQNCAWAYAVALEMLTELVMDRQQRAPETHGNAEGEGIKTESFFITAQ